MASPRVLEQGLGGIPGVGPARLAHLAAAGIETVRDLLTLFPRAARALPPVTPIADAAADLLDQAALVAGLDRGRAQHGGQVGRSFQ